MNAEIIAELLLKEKAVFLSPDKPFTWTSGIKAPIYCDNRLLISSVESRKIITKYFCEIISVLAPEVIAGTATAGIPWASFIAYELKLPLIYVRSSSKEHGRENAIEGRFEKGSKVVLIEDLISTGKSSVEAAKKLSEADLLVTKILSIFSYELPKATETFSEHKLTYQSLSNFDSLANVAFKKGQFDQKTLNDLISWRKGIKKYE